MFFVINKEKVYAYCVSIITIVILFFMSRILNSNIEEETEVSANIVTNAIITNTLNESSENTTIENVIETDLVPN